MNNNNVKIERCAAVNQTEKILAQLCDHAFLKMWVFPNPYREPNKELCDVLVIFDNNVIIFSVKDIKYNKDKGDIAWQRWKRKAIDESINQIVGAEKWLKKHPDKIFIDPACKNPIPINLKKNIRIYRMVIAHGVSDIISSNKNNISGSLAIKYSDMNYPKEIPYSVELPKDPIYHILDTANLEIVLNELDTITDFLNYLKEKEKTIKNCNAVIYSGEEDLMARYIGTIEYSTGKHYLVKDLNKNAILKLEDIIWRDFSRSYEYLEKKNSDSISYIWDEILAEVCNYALNGELIGNVDVFNEDSPIKEMAKESRFHRRILSFGIQNAIDEFPDIIEGNNRKVRFILSEDNQTAYVFLQIKYNEREDYENIVRPRRKQMLNVACGTLKNKYSKLKKVIGIAINSPKHHVYKDQDYILLNCQKWKREDRSYYYNLNKSYNFWTQSIQPRAVESYEYPSANI